MSELQCKGKKLWGGRFMKGIDPTLNKINASIHTDKRMYEEDIQASIAYAAALNKAKLLTNEENQFIRSGLLQIQEEWEKNEFIILPSDEDIHTAVERRLTELIGDSARKLHTGRSRNDQTITDTKLWLRKSINALLELLHSVIKVMVYRAHDNIHIIMPGYTHLQRAQPIRWSHWLLSYSWSLKNDAVKLAQIRKNVNVLPLGSGALAGNPFDIDRNSLADSLGFDGVTENSMQAVGDRDFVGIQLMVKLTNESLQKNTSVLLNVAVRYETHARNFATQIHRDNCAVKLKMSKREKIINLNEEGLLKDIDVEKEMEKYKRKDAMGKMEMMDRAKRDIIKLDNIIEQLHKCNEKHKKN